MTHTRLENISEIEIALYYWSNWKKKAQLLGSIAKVLLPKICQMKTLSNYGNTGACIDWLMSLDGELNWDTALEAARKEFHGD